MEKTTQDIHRRQNVRWIIGTLTLTILALAAFALPTILVDPFFHYHGPLDGLSYPIDDERYQNDGILRHFSYDSIITGSSMCENFKTSQAQELFGGAFVKIPISGCTYKEIDDNLRRAFSYGKEIKTIIYCLDYSRFNTVKDEMVDFPFPTYQYNQNPFDDVYYLLNKEVLLDKTRGVLKYTLEGNRTTGFDEYGSWANDFPLGAEYVLEGCGERIIGDLEVPMTELERENLRQSIRQNVTALAKEHPETDFYLFFPPYSICYWEGMRSDGKIGWHVEGERIVMEEVFACPNIRLFSFSDEFELVENLDNYRDMVHYGQHVSDWILACMASGEHELTKENCEEYLASIQEHYQNFDYSTIRNREGQ